MKSIIIILFISFFSFQKPNAQVLDRIPFSMKEYFEDQRKDIVKFNLTSPLLGNISFSYEHAFHPRKTIELKMGFIQSNKISPESLDGIYLGFGYKFFISPVHSIKRGWTVPVLQGFYIQPELLIGVTNKNISSSTSFSSGLPTDIPSAKQKINYQVVLVNFGLQTTVLKVLILDLFAAGGLGRDNLESNGKIFFPQNEAIYHQGILKTNRGISLAGKAGVRLGILF